MDIENEKEPDISKKKNRNIFVLGILTLFLYHYPQGDQQAKLSLPDCMKSG